MLRWIGEFYMKVIDFIRWNLVWEYKDIIFSVIYNQMSIIKQMDYWGYDKLSMKTVIFL